MNAAALIWRNALDVAQKFGSILGMSRRQTGAILASVAALVLLALLPLIIRILAFLLVVLAIEYALRAYYWLHDLRADTNGARPHPTVAPTLSRWDRPSQVYGVSDCEGRLQADRCPLSDSEVDEYFDFLFDSAEVREKVWRGIPSWLRPLAISRAAWDVAYLIYRRFQTATKRGASNA